MRDTIRYSRTASKPLLHLHVMRGLPSGMRGKGRLKMRTLPNGSLMNSREEADQHIEAQTLEEIEENLGTAADAFPDQRELGGPITVLGLTREAVTALQDRLRTGY